MMPSKMAGLSFLLWEPKSRALRASGNIEILHPKLHVGAATDQFIRKETLGRPKACRHALRRACAGSAALSAGGKGQGQTYEG